MADVSALWPVENILHTILIKIYNADQSKSILFRIPVNPERVEEVRTGSWADKDIIGKGETSVSLWPKSAMFKFSSFFPMTYDPTYCSIPEREMFLPDDYVRYFKAAVKNGSIIHIIVTNSEINGRYTIRNFDWSIQGGERGDIHYTLEFKEWNEGAVRKFSSNIVPTFPGTPFDLPDGFPKNAGLPPTVNPGNDIETNDPPRWNDPNRLDSITESCDTMIKISQKYFGKPNLWWVIWGFNMYNPEFQFETNRDVIRHCNASADDSISAGTKILKSNVKYFYPTDVEAYLHLSNLGR